MRIRDLFSGPEWR